VKIDLRRFLAPLLAALVLAAVLQQISGALRQAGTWRPASRAARVQQEDPYSRVEAVLARTPPPGAYERMRNPFVFGSAPEPATAGVERRPRRVQPVTPAAPARPVLTSIVWDSRDPRATVRYDGRDISVRENSLFADYRVRSISSTQLVLERRGETIVLTFRPKGD